MSARQRCVACCVVDAAGKDKADRFVYISKRPSNNPPLRRKMSTRNMRSVSDSNLARDVSDTNGDSDGKKLFPRDLGIKFLKELE